MIMMLDYRNEKFLPISLLGWFNFDVLHFDAVEPMLLASHQEISTLTQIVCQT